MKTSTVRYEVDLARLPPLTSAQRAEVAALKALPDSEIDTSDIAPLTDAFWQKAGRNPFYKPVKTSATVRVDAEQRHFGPDVRHASLAFDGSAGTRMVVCPPVKRH